jgi:hypothetical protein
MSEVRVKQLDLAELVVDAGRWRAGTVGTVVEIFGTTALVEISDSRGHSEDFLTLPYDVLQTIKAHDQEQLAIWSSKLAPGSRLESQSSSSAGETGATPGAD